MSFNLYLSNRRRPEEKLIRITGLGLGQAEELGYLWAAKDPYNDCNIQPAKNDAVVQRGKECMDVERDDIF